jgi:transcriptional regulator with XRE-family HTH domain
MNFREHATLYKAIGQRIRERRVKRGFTQNKLAELLSLSRTSITNIESGRQKLLIHTLVELAIVLDVDVSELLPEITISNTRPVHAAMPEGINETDRRFVTELVGERNKGE